MSSGDKRAGALVAATIVGLADPKTVVGPCAELLDGLAARLDALAEAVAAVRRDGVLSPAAA